jgi:hypothetical protein
MPQSEVANTNSPVRGRTTGLLIPTHPEAFVTAGTEFLTDAFRAYGSLTPDNRVTGLSRIEPCLIGSTGQKLFITVEYERPAPDLPTELFVKFSRHFTDPFHDRRPFELESEIRFFALSRKADFPIAVPRAMFGDFDPASGNGLLLIERVHFGQPPIEPLRAKCMDHEMARPLDHYRTIVKTLARLAGAHHAGRLSPEVEALFPFDPIEAEQEDPIEASAAELRALVARFAVFAERNPQFFPAKLRTPAFIDRLANDVVKIAEHQVTIRRHLHRDPRFVALTHFNPQIDNAWFWRDAANELQCGLFDWQRTRQMNVVYALWGGLCGAGLDIWTDHVDELLTLFADEFHTNGGPRLPVETLTLHLQLYAATMGTAGLLAAPAVVRARLPLIDEMSSPLDARLLANEGARCFLHIFTVFLNICEMNGFGENLDRILHDIRESTPAILA